MAVAPGNLLSCLCRYVVLGFLVLSVVYSTIFLFGSENLQKNAAGLIQKGASSLSGYSLGSQSAFDIENVRYSAQQMKVQAARQGNEPNTYAIYEDFYLSKAFGNAMQPSKVIPYYFKAEGVFDKEEVTITTLITENRFGVFKKLVRNYRGPISVTLWIRDDDFRDQHFAALHELYASEPLLRQYVDVHVVVDRFDFQLNMWRNVARLFARTDYFMLLDVDFHICTDLKRHLRENEMARKFLREGAALVLPAFEFTDERDGEDSATFPKDKRVVDKLAQGKKLVPFHSVKFAPGHEASNYAKWYATEDVYQVTSFNWKYEPYVILRREGTPWCDERFVGYGANKAACLYEIYISGIDYYVLPQDFLIHQSHAYPESKRSGGRKLNGELYSAFRDELCLRYAKSMYLANELYTHKADNLMSQCKQLKGFEDALKEFPRMWKSEPAPLLPMFGATKDFLGKPAPAGYIAGLGRGATGFTTRSDIGPAREGPTEADIARLQEQAKRKAAEDGDDDDERYQDPDNETGLFNTAPYEADDEEADQIYDSIDAKLDERRKARREAREKEMQDKLNKERPKIQDQFADLKRGLNSVSAEEWENLPEVGNIAGRGRKKANFKEKFTPVPDSLLPRAQEEMATTLDAQPNGLATPAPGTMTNFREIGEANKQVLGLRLDRMADSASGSTTIDPKGYLTDLNSVVVKSAAEIGDLKRARLLLKSVVSADSKHAPGWIAAARLEEHAGKLTDARQIIDKGCQECPKSEDIWLEAARLNSTDNAKKILANAVKQIPQSVKIWLQAVQLETTVKTKKIVIRRALDYVPNSVKLWKTAIEMEDDPNNARILLARAVELVPLSVELWIALARLETYENAKRVLNKARSTIPTSHEIWITAFCLEEANNKSVEKLVAVAVKQLAVKEAALTRDQWLEEAERCEKNGFIHTCQAIVRTTIAMGVEEPDLKSTWMEDAESAIAHQSYGTARAIYAHALRTFPNKKSIWRRAALLEKAHGTRDSLAELLARSVQSCPQAEVLWLMSAKEKWLGGDVPAARAILGKAFEANPNSEQIWLAAVKLEAENGEHGRAELLLSRARENADTAKVWIKSAVLERQLGKITEALQLLDQGLEKYPTADKLWMIKGQILVDRGDNQRAREHYIKALKSCPKSVPLWILYARLEDKAGLLVKARSLLERGRIHNPKTPELWLESVRVELRGNNPQAGKILMSKALQECPSSGLLWSESVWLETRAQRKGKIVDALKKSENSAHVLITAARLFWSDRQVEKARSWFLRAEKADADLGDAWAWHYKFEVEHGDEVRKGDLVMRFKASEPRHGEHWQSVTKDLKNVGKSQEEMLILAAASLPPNTVP